MEFNRFSAKKKYCRNLLKFYVLLHGEVTQLGGQSLVLTFRQQAAGPVLC